MAGVGAVWCTPKNAFHEGMKAEVRVGALLSDNFEVKNGL